MLEHVQDLLVGRALRQRRDRWPLEIDVGGHRADGLGRGRQRLAFSLSLAQPRGQFADLFSQFAFAPFDSVQELLNNALGHHASRHRADVSARRRNIRPAEAQ